MSERHNTLYYTFFPFTTVPSSSLNANRQLPIIIFLKHGDMYCYYEGNSISKIQIQVATYVFELSAGNCHR
jgi:hypothetical protein